MPTPAARRRRSIKQFVARLRGRPDSEHEMSFNRLAIVGVMIAYVMAVDPERRALPVLLAYWATSLAIFVQILFDQQAVRVCRRLAVMVMDITVISYLMYCNGKETAAFWPIYLWVIFGNGFRFGNAYLFATAGVSILCFAAVVAVTPFWHEATALSVGLLIGLLILPAYTSQLIRKLSTAKLKAEEASRAKSYFLASVSHELRTPLTAIIGLGTHLQSSSLGIEERGMANTIVSAGRTLLSQINQLLEFSRLGSKGLTAVVKPFELASLLGAVREMMVVAAEAKGLEIALHISPRVPLSLKGDEDHLRDVLINLVGNAVKFTERGGITISADVERSPAGDLMLRLAVTDTGVGIEAEAQKHIFDSFRQADHTIIDRYGGTGLGLAICRQVVELLGGSIGVVSAPGEGSRFWFTVKVDSASDSEAETADGYCAVILSENRGAVAAIETNLIEAGASVSFVRSPGELVRRLRRKDSGRINVGFIHNADAAGLPAEAASLKQWVAGEAGLILVQGEPLSDADARTAERLFASVATLDASADELSRVLKIASQLQPGAAPAEVASAPAFTPRRVLVADDNGMNQKVFGMILGRAAHQVTSAANGEAALDVMKDEQVDIVLMDVNMPILNGIEATKLHRFMALGRRRIPIIGITADASPETAERCREAGMDGCLAKPIEAAALLQLIEELTKADDARVPNVDPAGIVTPLFPKRQESEPAIQWEKIDELEELGGPDFVADLLAEFVSDTGQLIAAVRTSVSDGDVEGFRSATHALRSSGANIGAGALAEMCRHFQRIDEREFDAKGALHLEALQAELDRVRQTLSGSRPSPARATSL
jgi:two-component system, sensor histidine kinase RpfC